MLSLKYDGISFANKNKDNHSYASLTRKIRAKQYCEITYNSSKTAAILNLDCGSAIYINFKTKQTFAIANSWSNVFPRWINETVAVIEGPCGTGCAKDIMFFAPATAISCAVHEYRIESLNKNEPPDYYNNIPLLIDPKREVYVCYDDEDRIQVFPFPKHKSINPPQGYYSEKAAIQNNHLIVTYKNRHGKVKRVAYDVQGSSLDIRLNNRR